MFRFVKNLFIYVAVPLAFILGIASTRVILCGAACNNRLLSVDAKEFLSYTQETGVKIIDLRTPEEYKKAHIKKRLKY